MFLKTKRLSISQFDQLFPSVQEVRVVDSFPLFTELDGEHVCHPWKEKGAT